MGLALAIFVPFLAIFAVSALLVLGASVFGIIFSARALKKPENKGALMVVVIISCAVVALVSLAVLVGSVYAIIGLIGGALMM